MNKYYGYIAQTLDGYISDENGNVEWLNKYNEMNMDNEEIMNKGIRYEEFIKKIDVVVMGKKTYDQVMSWDISWPYNDQHSIVLTSKKMENTDKVTFINYDDINVVTDFITNNYPDKNIWVMGGAIVSNWFLDHNLIDEYLIFTAPELLGSGIKLFSKNKPNNFDVKDLKMMGPFTVTILSKK